MNYGIENLRPTKGVHHQYISNARHAELTVAGCMVALVAAFAVLGWAVIGHMPEIIGLIG